ncbi:hypothetical protein [Mesorhizobium sp.]|uniref:hypothetical protein n=1 Tax=Mesorhizobium sp. TaxID=1871066 RepID=UPI000FE87621|nr:hypothetical protein [Mesorhizobium sp.]RWK54289.1 MAG: hypothetical protein EOR48_17955 [Mesorhizobium sp.]TIP42650.1 MAG: hypothetical protein E5X62_21400 [Mesorhizobium sp.]
MPPWHSKQEAKISSIYDWSLIAANNGAADAQINYAEGMPPSAVNNSARQAMARNAEILGDIGGALTAGGTADALTVTANSAFTTYANGQVLALKIATDNTGAATLNVNGIGAKSIRKMLSSGESALTGAELQATGIYILMYQSALNAAAGAWLLLNPTMDLSAYVTLTGAQTLTNKTLTSPAINTPTITGGSGSGMTLTTATLTTPTLTLKQSAAPTPTAEGDTQWDTDDNVLAIGDGAATKLFLPIPASTAAGDIEYYTAAKVTARLAKGTAGQTLRMNSGATAPEWGGGNGAPDAVLEDQKASGTGGGTTVNSVWTTHALNTEVRDPSGLVSISSNQFTPTVDGWVDWQIAVGKTTVSTRLQNMTDGATVGMGMAGVGNSSPNTGAVSCGGGVVVAGKAYAIQYFSGNAVAEGLGAPQSQGTEVYARVNFWRTT